MATSRASVLRGAFTILDSYGLGDLTMRRLAAELGIQPGALYWHFRDKQTLLAAMADVIVAAGLESGSAAEIGSEPVSAAGIESAAVAGWRAQLTAISSGFRDALLAHRDGAELVAAGVALNPGSGEPVETMTKIIADAGLDPATAAAAAGALTHFILGQTAEQQAHDQLRAAAESRAGQRDQSTDPDQGFAVGVAIFLDGLSVRI